MRIYEKAFSIDNYPLKPAKRSGFYHGGHIPEEIVALSSFFLRRRFKLGPIVRMDDRPILLSVSKKQIDEPLVKGKSNLEDLTKWLKLVERLDSKLHQSFILAVRLYHLALLMIEEHPDMAYLNLVSSIETLSQKYDIEKGTLSDLDSELAQLVGSVENIDLRNKLEQTILKRERFVSRRFIAFILNHTEESFWTEEKRPEHGQIKREKFADLLKLIYGQRSRTLHNGEPFPRSIFYPPHKGAEIPSSLSFSSGEKRWDPQDFIPYPHFFERLVNHVLKTFLKRNQVERE